MIESVSAARAFVSPATTGAFRWWDARRQRSRVVLTAPRLIPHHTCPDGPHATLGTSTVGNWSNAPLFDVRLRLEARLDERRLAKGCFNEKYLRHPLGPGETSVDDWGERRAGHASCCAPPLLMPNDEGVFEFSMSLEWADHPSGPRWRLGPDGAVRRAPGHEWRRRAGRSLAGPLTRWWRRRRPASRDAPSTA
ncbi:hypothetical protein JGS22_001960 [Streptomyces sp. P38-E01]|uniref:Uncharacterized protein n=1 Tax=Streptomyces tardus TaxID=2780544 RepID=A0A949N405_9ACTN|nr:hypothetical protein [Streptomyces tardus]MBU7596437.1 hypothetical protein [Streptomyces tardus]